MASRLTLIPLFAVFLAAAAVAGSVSDEENPIRLVTDNAREAESAIHQALGAARHAMAFARFARRSANLIFFFPFFGDVFLFSK